MAKKTKAVKRRTCTYSDEDYRQAAETLVSILASTLDPDDYIQHKQNLFGLYEWSAAVIAGRRVEPVDHADPVSGKACGECKRNPQDTRQPLTDAEEAAHPVSTKPILADGKLAMTWACGCGVSGEYQLPGGTEGESWIKHVLAARTRPTLVKVAGP